MTNLQQPQQAKLEQDGELPSKPEDIPREGPAVYQPIPRGLIAAIVIGLCVWGGYLAVGSWLGGDKKFQLGPNFWRGVVVTVCFALFLAFWGILWRFRKPKKAKYRR